MGGRRRREGDGKPIELGVAEKQEAAWGKRMPRAEEEGAGDGPHRPRREFYAEIIGFIGMGIGKRQPINNPFGVQGIRNDTY